MKKKTCVIICVILAVIMFLANIGTIYSTTIDQLQQQKNDIQSKIDQANKEIQKLSSEMSAVQVQISQLNAQISIYQEEIDRLQAQITENEAKLVQLQATFDKRKDTLAKRIIAQYENGDITYLDFLLSSESLTDFISNYYILGEIADMDAELLKGLETTKAEIEATKQQLETDKASVQEQKTIVESKKAERETYRNQLAAQKAQAEASKDQFNKAIQAVQSQIDEAIKAAGGYHGSFSGTLSWPLSSSSRNYNLITSGYGMRGQPTAGASTNHKALDIGVSYQPVYAPADGYVVIAASGYGGYGNFIMLKHSNTLYTCYGHLNKFNVSVGQTVSRGQQIATSGNTGISTGPHLHFEVRTGSGYSSRVNPLNYIDNYAYSKLVFAF